MKEGVGVENRLPRLLYYTRGMRIVLTALAEGLWILVKSKNPVLTNGWFCATLPPRIRILRFARDAAMIWVCLGAGCGSSARDQKSKKT